MQSWVPDVFLFLWGIFVGSFLNVCVHRFLKEESIIAPRSYCPNCRKSIAWYDNIPLISYILLGGRCRNCHLPIAMRYFFVELLTGLIFLGSVRYFGWTAQGGASIVLLTLLLGISAADLEEQIIPDEMSLSGILLGWLFSVTFPTLQSETSRWMALGQSFLGALVGGGMIYLTGVFGQFVFRKESMGGGDVKLMAMLGAFLGWANVLMVFFIAPFLALPIGLYVKFKKKEEYIPFGPFLSLGGVLVLFFGEPLIRIFFHYYF
ncbi:MAG: prepilin peptidase [Candidatus Omnitrophica bacterium CG11_big_fil_rev_8_21_14_0_20_45_26]|uniref:Prepilin leader peptidase/N-methyltransferase n=1 Tax=Candidatus Abzuiibacterium crystallinum TaxID=1974748 RepID=A0A2H0LMN8_9BACT|nr:MAG: prepilin peptidase [Candidatus Omnitrophica bacterium CG11_big_fil_rev_8_21_14_0_20_45_26]PIW65162.1 MAG: prepilin peptidase [Candidatus Omnitrophica bacterium CG12_big_fil_rev_8_21_14_0_65_45_16]